jgi:large-conductance mechanosensitive channel
MLKGFKTFLRGNVVDLAVAEVQEGSLHERRL